MRRELLDLASDLARRGEPFALATVVARKPPVSAQVGDMALVTRDGSLHGWVGGSCTSPTVIAEARRALEDGAPGLLVLAPEPEAGGSNSRKRPGVKVFPMTCHSGGSVEIHIQPVLPPPVLVVYGISPTARALARLAKAMGYAVHAVDPMADASAFPGADSVSTGVQYVHVPISSPNVSVVVATQGQWDEEAVLAALAHEPRYLGVVASAKRFAEMRGLFAGKASEAVLSRIKSPAGLDLHAESPEEIALSILAEIVQLRRTGLPSLPSRVSEEARDPVCGMAVRVEGARHRAEHDGRDFFFCCPGCRERFLAAPARYLAVPDPGGHAKAVQP